MPAEYPQKTRAKTRSFSTYNRRTRALTSTRFAARAPTQRKAQRNRRFASDKHSAYGATAIGRLYDQANGSAQDSPQLELGDRHDAGLPLFGKRCLRCLSPHARGVNRKNHVYGAAREETSDVKTSQRSHRPY